MGEQTHLEHVLVQMDRSTKDFPYSDYIKIIWNNIFLWNFQQV